MADAFRRSQRPTSTSPREKPLFASRVFRTSSPSARATCGTILPAGRPCIDARPQLRPDAPLENASSPSRRARTSRSASLLSNVRAALRGVRSQTSADHRDFDYGPCLRACRAIPQRSNRGRPLPASVAARNLCSRSSTRGWRVDVERRRLRAPMSQPGGGNGCSDVGIVCRRLAPAGRHPCRGHRTKHTIRCNVSRQRFSSAVPTAAPADSRERRVHALRSALCAAKGVSTEVRAQGQQSEDQIICGCSPQGSPTPAPALSPPAGER